MTSARTKLVDLQPSQARARQRVDQPHLVGGRDDLGLVLEAVARPDLADADRGRKRRRRAHFFARVRVTLAPTSNDEYAFL